jgi:integrase
VKFFNEDNSRLRYLTEDEYNRLIQAAKTIEKSPFVAEKILLSVHTGLRRGSLFHLRWDYVDFLNRRVRILRTKTGRPHAIPLNATVMTTLQALYTERLPDCPYVFAHAAGRKAGEPVKDVKNGFHTALEIAQINDFTWHDLRHTFASWLIMKGASLRSVAYAHLSPVVLVLRSGAAGRADTNAAAPGRDAPWKKVKKRAMCTEARSATGESRQISAKNGSPHWTISATG